MDPSLLVGKTLAGKYRLDAMIDAGGFGAVFSATQAPLGQRVALKVNLRSQPDLRRRFEREAKLLARLRHARIVRLIDYGEHVDPVFGTLLFMVQEYVPGSSLETAFTHRRRFTPGEAVTIVSQVLDALEEAHHHGIVHRDIKPANLMLVEARGRTEVQVLDFGIAKIVEADGSGGNDIATRRPLGTPAYMAPEQWSTEPVSPATDLYAIGVLLYRMLAGAQPFESSGASWAALMRAHCDQPVPRLPADVPSAFDAVIARAMAKRPADRYGSAAEMRAALEAALDAQPRARWPLWVSLGAAAVAVAVAMAVGGRDAPPEEADAARIVIGGHDGGAQPAVGVADGGADDGRPDAIRDITPDATKDTITDAIPDASARPEPDRRRRRRAPKPIQARPPARPDPATVTAEFDRALAACRCDVARRHLDALSALDPPQAAVKRRRYEEECQMPLPGNCRSR